MGDERFDVVLKSNLITYVLFVVVGDIAYCIHYVFNDFIIVAILYVGCSSYSPNYFVSDEVIEELGIVLGQITQKIESLLADQFAITHEKAWHIFD
jgi:hypothetical protein